MRDRRGLYQKDRKMMFMMMSERRVDFMENTAMRFRRSARGGRLSDRNFRAARTGRKNKKINREERAESGGGADQSPESGNVAQIMWAPGS